MPERDGITADWNTEPELRDWVEDQVRAADRLERLEAAEARSSQLEEALREAIEFADEGWAYASDYFREKWNYDGERNKLLAALNSDNPDPTDPPHMVEGG